MPPKEEKSEILRSANADEVAKVSEVHPTKNFFLHLCVLCESKLRDLSFCFAI